MILTRKFIQSKKKKNMNTCVYKLLFGYNFSFTLFSQFFKKPNTNQI